MDFLAKRLAHRILFGEAEDLAHRILFGEAEDPKNIFRRMSAHHTALDRAYGREQRPEPVCPCQDWPYWDDLDEWHQAAAQELEEDLDCQFSLKSYDSDSFEVSTSGHTWYKVFRDDDAARLAAIRYAQEGIETEPENWNHNGFLRQFVDLERVKRDLYNDAREDDYWNDEHPSIESKIEELIDRDYLDEDPLIDSDGNTLEVTPEIEQMVAEKWEDLIDSHATRQLEDPIAYLQNFCSETEAWAKAIDLGGIDAYQAAQSAVDTDGWPHFIGHYDGQSHDLPGGAVYVRA